MLESRRLVLRSRGTLVPSTCAIEISDPDTEPRKPVGLAEDARYFLPHWLHRRLIRPLFGTRIEVREYPDESLVFVIGVSSVWTNAPIEVQDALGATVGRIRETRSVDRLILSWPDGSRFATVRRSPAANSASITAPDGRHYAQLTRFDGPTTDILLDTTESLEGQPLAMMLVVSVAILMSQQLIDIPPPTLRTEL